MGISTSGRITGTVSYQSAAGSPNAVTVTVRDPAGHSASQSFTWTVTETDTTPTLAVQPNRTNAEGDVVDVQLTGAADVDGDTPTWSAAGLPAGLGISTSGRITGTVSYQSAAGSPYAVTVTVRDPAGHSASRPFTWTITNTDTTPTLAVQPNRTNAEGDVVDVQLTGAADVDGDTPTWSAAGLPAGLGISTSGRITGTVSYQSAAGSPYAVTVTVRDPAGHSASRTFTWTVTNADTTPTLAEQPGRDNYEGQTVNVQLTGAGDVDGDRLTWSATGLPSGLSISTAGRITGTVANGAAAGSPYPVTATVSDSTPGGPIGDSASRTFPWTVRRPTLTVTSPNGGEEWSIGTRAAVIWESAGVRGALKMELSRDGGARWEVLSSGAPNTGTFPWTVTGTQMTSRALVRITSLLNRSVVDVSDQPFNILNRYGDSRAVFQLGDGIAAAGRHLSLLLRFTANQADVTAATMDVLYDPTLLTFRQAGPGALAGISVVSRVKRAGCVGLIITGFPKGVWDRDDVAVLVFQAADGAAQGDSTAVALALPDTGVPGVDVYDRAVEIRVARAKGLGGTVHFGAYGDLNHNGIVDVGDVQVMKNVLLNYVAFSPALHDLDFNGVKDAGDLSALTDLFLYQGRGAAPAAARDAREAGRAEPQAILSEANIDFSTGTNRITAIAFALKAALQAGEVTFVPPDGTPARDDLKIVQGQLADGVMRVLVYSDTRTPLPSYATFNVKLKAPPRKPPEPLPPGSPGSEGNGGALKDGTLVAVAFVAPPGTPAITSCRAVSTVEVQMTWAHVAGSVSYDIFRGEPWSETPLANVPAAGTGDQAYRDARLGGRTGVVAYKIRARNAVGRVSAFSGAKSVTVLPAPTGVQATALSSTQVQAAWLYSAPGATAFIIECKGSTGDWASAGTATASARSRTVTVMAPGTNSYRVKATNAAAVSSPSSASTLTVLPSVTELHATTPSSSEVQLDWSYPAGITGYTFVVERMVPGATEHTAIAALSAVTRHYNDKQAVVGACRYRVRAHRSRGYSSGPVAAITVLAAPTGLAAAVVADRQVKLDWVDNSAGEGGFKIERFDNGAATPSAIASVAADVQTRTLTMPRAGEYAFRVRAYHSRGFSSYSSTQSVRLPW